ncbi:VOC family protein [Cochlodiniinecator piscidefendens]|uniref:VOC family protein n=1 Tax=Cochlodiniinecator piscidefendens TaxID=2715756 RepID=UPI00140E925E|nr:VOC family protein [Cochlodiniinecator piscidefendens]
MKIAQIELIVPNSDVNTAFYLSIFGMKPQMHGLGFSPDQGHLAFQPGDNSGADSDSFYWKIGITLRDLDHAVTYLQQHNVPVSQPRQFRDIGYMAHLTDPSGNTIELLQQGFEGREIAPGAGHPIGGQATLAHLTLRIRDIQAARAWADQQGLTLMSVQPVSEYGFTLYFYAWTDEKPPNPDLYAVENREWLWARPYTILELQHLEGDGPVPLAHPIKAMRSSEGVLSEIPLRDLNV